MFSFQLHLCSHLAWKASRSPEQSHPLHYWCEFLLPFWDTRTGGFIIICKIMVGDMLHFIILYSFQRYAALFVRVCIYSNVLVLLHGGEICNFFPTFLVGCDHCWSRWWHSDHPWVCPHFTVAWTPPTADPDCSVNGKNCSQSYLWVTQGYIILT